MLIPRFFAGISVIGLMALSAGVVSGQDYPNKTIRIVTAAAGGGSDFNARQIAQGISGPLGQPVIVENRTPLQASEAISKAPPDGYALMVGGDSLWTLSLLRQTPYDPVRDFSPISLISMDVNVFLVHPSLPARSVKEFPLPPRRERSGSQGSLNSVRAASLISRPSPGFSGSVSQP